MIALAIARQTVNEALRRRIMWVFLISGFALLALMPLFGYLAPKDSQTVLRSLGLAAILLAGLFITIVTCIYLIPVEIERRTIYTVLSKPVQRYEFVLGKFLGGFLTVAINILSMGIVFLAMLYLQSLKESAREHGPVAWLMSGTFAPEMVRGIFMTFFQMLLLAALTIFFSTFTTPIVNFFLSFGIFMVGNLSTVTDSLTTNSNPVVHWAGTIIHYLLPNFGNFNIQNALIHPTNEITNPTQYMWNNIIYALIYSSVLLILAIIVFDRREV